MAMESSPRVDDSQAATTKRRIIDSATREFAAYGFAGARINRIASEASANKQLIYRYFGGKQELYEAVLTEMTRTSRALLAHEHDSGMSYVDFLTANASGIDRASEFPLWARILGWEGMTNASQAPHIDELRRANFRSRSEWIRGNQDSGEITSRYSPELLNAMLMAVTIFPITMPKTFKLILDKEEISDDDLREWFTFVDELVRDRSK
ncbi:MAG: TetR/AcrR family transcriptional regulator [Candidatus Saccharibacteria bacterium]|nr:TetR/AcrR family transcriptional regulator [Microbacteriaceae bacterium]